MYRKRNSKLNNPTQTTLYLDSYQDRFLSLYALVNKSSKSEVLRKHIEELIRNNEDIWQFSQEIQGEKYNMR